MSQATDQKPLVFKLQGKKAGSGHPTYFIADIAANHDGDLNKAKDLIALAKDAGADAAKFQHFTATKIVSDYGFRNLGRNLSHQAKWEKSVTEVYQDASVPWEWTPELKKTCDEVGILFFSTPYDLEIIDKLDAYVPAYKIGSGDITWFESLERIASKQKPTFLATGASIMSEVRDAVRVFTQINPQLCLMQCNTSYTGSLENFKHIHLNALKTFALEFPQLMLGLSDHTPGHSTVLGAVALGACAIEKHFTNDRNQNGPDHPFSMDPKSWREMVDRTRELEQALGDSDKFLAGNESDTAIIQRRCCRAARCLKKGAVIGRGDIDVLRPAKPGSVMPQDIDKLFGKRLRSDIRKGEAFEWLVLE